MLDVVALKQDVDLLALIGADTRLTKAAGTRGGEYAGACPFCGGLDRLRVQPDRGLWWCRQCSADDHWQDAIAYVQQRERLNFREAVQRLGGELAGESAPPRPVTAPTPLSVEPPPVPWQAAALQVVEACEAALWSTAGVHARTYLSDRGLTEESARTYRLGLSQRDQQIAGLWVEAGIVIPWFLAGALWQLKVRRRQPRDGHRYTAVKGGHPVLFGAHTLADHRAAVITEGEFDAILLEQEAGDLVGVCTLGNARGTLPVEAMRHFLGVRDLLVCYDVDAAGDRGAAALLARSARMQRIRVPLGKDLGEFWAAGGSLPGFVRRELDQLQAPPAAPVPVADALRLAGVLTGTCAACGRFQWRPAGAGLAWACTDETCSGTARITDPDVSRRALTGGAA